MEISNVLFTRTVLLKLEMWKKKQDLSLQLLTAVSTVIPGNSLLSWGTSELVSDVSWTQLLSLETNEGVIKGLFVNVKSHWAVGMALLLCLETTCFSAEASSWKMKSPLPITCALGAKRKISTCHQTQVLTQSYHLFFHQAFSQCLTEKLDQLQFYLLSFAAHPLTEVTRRADSRREKQDKELGLSAPKCIQYSSTDRCQVPRTFYFFCFFTSVYGWGGRQN